MKNWTAIFFLTSYLIGITPLGELCKLPKLVEHYLEHKKENQDLSVLGFLELHYFNGDPMDDDYAEDMKLPFKTVNVNAYDFVQLIVDLPQLMNSRTCNKVPISEPLPFVSLHISLGFANAIWQPPQVA